MVFSTVRVREKMVCAWDAILAQVLTQVSSTPTHPETCTSVQVFLEFLHVVKNIWIGLLKYFLGEAKS